MPSVMRPRPCALLLSTLWKKSVGTRILIGIGYRLGSTVGANIGHSKDWIRPRIPLCTIPNWGRITAFGIVQALVRIPNRD
ncbi:hypothetical protein A9978_08580 [Pseudomonas sp. UMC65]|nr:hypothetical protein [Pseudomonas sp. UMC65]MBB1622750.1 hypothetical protein [Pseudomonas sp. UME65]